MIRFTWPVRFLLALTIGCAVLLASSAVVSPKSPDEQRSEREHAESSRFVDALVKKFGAKFGWNMPAKGNLHIMVDGIANVDTQDEIRDWLIAEKARTQMMFSVNLEFYAKEAPYQPFHDLLRTREL